MSQLTKAAGPWIPRLERLVESRDLCNFEKNVLLALIGATLQPDKFDTDRAYVKTKSGLLHGERFHHILMKLTHKNVNVTSKSTISSVLRQLCTGLEEKIHNLKYFHKNATLIREGMLVVKSADISGDILGASVSLSYLC